MRLYKEQNAKFQWLKFPAQLNRMPQRTGKRPTCRHAKLKTNQILTYLCKCANV